MSHWEQFFAQEASLKAIKRCAVVFVAVIGYFLAFFCLLTVVTIFHEAGHVLALWICGEEVLGVVIGAGDALFALRVGDVIVVVGDLPFLGGATYFSNDAFTTLPLVAQVFIGISGVVVGLCRSSISDGSSARRALPDVSSRPRIIPSVSRCDMR